MPDPDLLPYDENGNCLTCHERAHSRFYDYDTFANLLHVSPKTIRTWASLTNTFIEEAHPNLESAWRQLKAIVNGLPTGAPIVVRLRPKMDGKRGRAFQPLPQVFAPGLYDGCVALARARGILIGPTYRVMDAVMAENSRKKAAEALRGGKPGGRK